MVLREISRRTRTLADRTRTRMLAIEDMNDATFIINNFGTLGIERFDALVTPFQGAILAVGAPLQPVTL
ncbi:2-oxo acid dehydrogenase subunit E2 [Plantibacter sp. CFBP 8804]|uniref:2-oxo acid dehydrogenase subunit E2 n=1 Tax=Plantibacter sp. CFBP 8804 TaxID=2775270 RepID=UPI00177BFCA5|nr:2-oxo acid dehydrogenase subunit E2 [Plantibacter sp. CFBP 8804]MBD8518880.1 2-oxo acid dehydrogenase subunit E2 [Plantibacter sp. CFBP 8804]